MLTKEKRNKIIAGAIVLSMLASTASMVYPWWMFWHWPMFGGTTTNVRQGTPVPGNAAGTDANTAGNSKVSGAEGTKSGTTTSKVTSPSTGKTGISSGAARSSAVS